MPDNANPIISKRPAPAARPQPSANRRLIDDLLLGDARKWAVPARPHASSSSSSSASSSSVEKANDSSEEEELVGYSSASADEEMDEPEEDIDADEVFDLIRSITDPEHPLTLEQLAVVSASQITVTGGKRARVLVEFTPTIPHCSMATLIGLSIRVRLLRALPARYKVDIRVREGSHQSENAVNRQLNDKERVAAALENSHLVDVVGQCLKTAHLRGGTLDDPTPP